MCLVDCLCTTSEIILPLVLNFCGVRAGYIKKLKGNVGELKTELQKLTEQREDVLRRVLIEEQRAMQRLNVVQGWLSRVETEKTETDELLSRSSEEIDKLCVGGYCSTRCKSTYDYGKNVAKKLEVVRKLKDEGKFDKVTEKLPNAAAADEKPIHQLASHSNNGEP